MDKQKAIELLMLLSALESWSFSSNTPLPDYLHERLEALIEYLVSLIEE